jgi:flagellar biosynthesis protein FlhA
MIKTINTQEFVITMKIGNAEINSKTMMQVLHSSLRHRDILFAVGILAIIGVLIFPVPAWLIDILLTLSITFSVLILMTVLFIDKPLDFSSFPTLLLVVTMFRLSLNISTTRLILSYGHEGVQAAGHIVQAFGGFVMGGSLVIGVIVFGILTIINFVVITKGSGRIAEVAARFSLDAMPGKQMAIDADLSAGIITEEQAKARRQELENENTFFGSMDGANKFVRGDAIAGLLITLINFIAGIVIGVVQRDMTFTHALHTYSMLTVGDGLVNQIPALIVSTSAGLLVTKSGVKGSVEKAIFAQLGHFPQALGVSSGLLAFMAIMPGLPFIPFMTTSAMTGLTAYLVYLEKLKEPQAPEGEASAENIASSAVEQSLGEQLQIEMIKLELGYELLGLVNQQKGLKITDQIRALRKQIARDLGFVMPSVRIQDNLQLPRNCYVIRIKEIECGKAIINPDKLLVMNPTGGEIAMLGEDTKEPTFGLAAKWIKFELREEALGRGYTVVEPATVITTHLTEIIKENVTELLSYSETQKLVDNLGAEHKNLVLDLIPSQLTITQLQRVLQRLLSEGISIRDLPTILEALSEIVKSNIGLVMMTEHVRSRLAKQICNMCTNSQDQIPMLVLSPRWEQEFNDNIKGEGDGRQLVMAPSKIQEFVNHAHQVFEKFASQGELPVLLTSPQIRPFVALVIERFRSNIFTMSQNEVHPRARIKTVGQL